MSDHKYRADETVTIDGITVKWRVYVWQPATHLFLRGNWAHLEDFLTEQEARDFIREHAFAHREGKVLYFGPTGTEDTSW